MLFTASSKASTFSFILAISGLISFTLSHCGSYAPLSTLALGITTSEPRLGTGCWLDFTRQAFMLYDISLNPSGSIARHRYLYHVLHIYLIMKFCSRIERSQSSLTVSLFHTLLLYQIIYFFYQRSELLYIQSRAGAIVTAGARRNDVSTARRWTVRSTVDTNSSSTDTAAGEARFNRPIIYITC